MRRSFLVAAVALVAASAASGAMAQSAKRPHNVVLFVADGLRSRMVDDTSRARARRGQLA